jgi:hypothetical protein
MRGTYKTSTWLCYHYVHHHYSYGASTFFYILFVSNEANVKIFVLTEGFPHDSQGSVEDRRDAFHPSELAMQPDVH